MDEFDDSNAKDWFLSNSGVIADHILAHMDVSFEVWKCMELRYFFP